MAPQDYAGRIDKRTYVIASSSVFAIAVIALTLRFYHRITHRRLDIDDALLAFGAAALVSAFVTLLVQAIDRLYLVTALAAQMPGVVPPGDPPGNEEAIWQMTNDFHNWMVTTLALSWSSIMAAKFTFLIFFWKLIDRMNKMRMYWYFVFAFNVGVFIYGGLSLYLTCPYFNDRRLFKCNTVKGNVVLYYAFPSMGVDILGDLLILVIPFTIVCKIRISPSSKLALLLSLGLTVFVIAINVIVMSGAKHNDQFDWIWESFWVFINGSVAMFMAAAIAFRTIFVARSKSKTATPPGQNRFFGSNALRRFHNWDSLGPDTENEAGLPSIPGAQLTGLRTLIDNQGSTTVAGSERSKSAPSSAVTTVTSSLA
ncbi:hypothetical protein J1614_008084 [Plenodomus biglobosus]|nr:hypothetical protein J1614_008084 [Plenodomus biglobosus]